MALISTEEFEQIYNEYFTTVYRLLRRLCSNHEDAEELTGETFQHAFQDRENLGKAENAKRWLFQRAKWVWQNHGRRGRTKKRAAPTLSFDGPSYPRELVDEHPGTNPLDIVLSNEQLGIVRQFLTSPPNTRAKRCFILHFLKEKSHQEVATLMNITPNAVRSHISQVRLKLKQYIEGLNGKQI